VLRHPGKPIIEVVMRRWLVGSFLGLVVLLSEFGSGWALGEEKEKSIFDLRFDLGFWSIVVFLALYFILKKYAWGPILQGLQKREHSIRSAISDAKLAREESEKMRAQLQQELDKAGEKVNVIIEQARRDGQRMTDEMVSKARSEIQVERDRLRREIDMAKDQALQELWGQTAQLATMIAAKAIRRSINVDDHRKLVDEALAEMKQRGAGGPL
jgi:F-type H+-transporting ATPase subunit b